MDVAVDGAGNVYIAEPTDIRAVTSDGIIAPIPGSTGPANDPFDRDQQRGAGWGGQYLCGRHYFANQKTKPRRERLRILAGPHGSQISILPSEPATAVRNSAVRREWRWITRGTCWLRIREVPGSGW